MKVSRKRLTQIIKEETEKTVQKKSRFELTINMISSGVVKAIVCIKNFFLYFFNLSISI